MKTLRINFLVATLACLAVSIFCDRGLRAAQTNDEPRSLFLHLGPSREHILFVEFTVRVPAFSAAKRIDRGILAPAPAAKREKNVVGRTVGSVVWLPNQSPPP